MEEQEASLAADVTAEVSDQDVDKFFEGGGNEEPAGLEEKETTDTEKEQKEPEEAQSRNYKAAMHEEREKRKELQRQVQEINNKNQRLEQTFQQYVQQLNQQRNPEPTFDEDPLAALKLNQERLQGAFQVQHEKEMQRQQQYNAQIQQHQFISRYAESAEAFTQDKPDFKDAYNFLTKSRVDEYIHCGYNRQQAEQLLREDEAAIVAKAYNDGVNPAERIYNVAKMRGYKMQAQQQTAEDKINQLERGVKASKSLSGGGGKTSESITLEELANMLDDPHADKAATDKAWKKLIGG